MEDDIIFFRPAKQPAASKTADPVDSQGIDESDVQAEASESGVQVNQEKGFNALGLDPWMLETLAALSLTQPTPIQQACIPAILTSKRDVVGVAQTGSGKTAAFVLPILHHLNRSPYGPHTLILTPTRELAVQLEEQVRAFGRDVHVQTALVVGGMDIVNQQVQLQKCPHIIIATPGRLCDLLQSSPGLIVLRRLAFVVVDEADRLLDSSSTFADEMPIIWGALSRTERPRFLMFTATMTADVGRFAGPGAFHFSSTSTGTSDDIDQRYLFIPSKVKDCYLYYLLSRHIPDKTVIVFVGKCLTAELLCQSMRHLKLAGGIVSLHSQHRQRQRIEALASFRNGTARILIATDVASRGLDIPQVHTVINYDLPADPRDYIHRIGRTGRAGLRGHSVSFVGELDIEVVKAVEGRIGKMLAEYDSLDEDVVLEWLNKCSDARQHASMRLEDEQFGERRRRNLNKLPSK